MAQNPVNKYENIVTPAAPPNPKIGQIVLYVLTAMVIRPAIVVNTFGSGYVSLQVFTDGSNDSYNIANAKDGIVWVSSRPYDKDKMIPETWHYRE